MTGGVDLTTLTRVETGCCNEPGATAETVLIQCTDTCKHKQYSTFEPPPKPPKKPPIKLRADYRLQLWILCAVIVMLILWAIIFFTIGT